MSEFFTKVKDYALGIFAVIAAIFGALFWYEKKQNEVQKAENLTAKTDGKIEVIDNEIKSIEDETKRKKDEEVTQSDLIKFLNDSNKPK